MIIRQTAKNEVGCETGSGITNPKAESVRAKRITSAVAAINQTVPITNKALGLITLHQFLRLELRLSMRVAHGHYDQAGDNQRKKSE